ncbi:MAG: hypothetical protein R2695_13240 [Acidimicrobiales bacterium]
MAGATERAARPTTTLGPPEQRVGLLGIVALAASVGVLVITPDHHAVLFDLGSWPLVLVIMGFVASEPLVFHIESRNEAVSFSPSDVPLAIGLLTLDPFLLLGARLLGSGWALLVFRRQPLFKFCLNLSAFAVEATVATFALRLALGPSPDA